MEAKRPLDIMVVEEDLEEMVELKVEEEVMVVMAELKVEEEVMDMGQMEDLVEGEGDILLKAEIAVVVGEVMGTARLVSIIVMGLLVMAPVAHVVQTHEI